MYEVLLDVAYILYLSPVYRITMDEFKILLGDLLVHTGSIRLNCLQDY